MLSELIGLLEESPGEWNLQELSRTLGVPSSVVSGMLELLIEKGRILETDPVCGECKTCSIRHHCDVPVSLVKRYRLRSRSLRTPARLLSQGS